MGAGTCIVLFTLVTWRLEQCLSERVLNKTFLVESVNKSLMSINYIPNKAIKRDIKAAVSNSFGFGGNDSTLIFRKYE